MRDTPAIDPPSDLRALAASLFGEPEADELMPRLERFAALVREWNKRGNLVSSGDADRLLTRHIPESLLIAAHVRKLKPTSVVDLGSGAGFPGIPLAMTNPASLVVLIDSRRMKSLFLLRAIGELGLTRCFTWCGRAEEIGTRVGVEGIESGRAEGQESSSGWSRLSVEPPARVPPFDLATARAVAPLPRLTNLAEPFLKSGGRLLAAKGSRVEEELASWRGNPGAWDLESGPVPLLPAPGGEIRADGLAAASAQGGDSPRILVLRHR